MNNVRIFLMYKLFDDYVHNYHLSEERVRTFQQFSFVSFADRMPLLLSLISCSLYPDAFLTPNSFQDDLRPILSTSSRRCTLRRWPLHGGFRDPHRIIFGNYLRYSNSKRALPFNGPEKIRVTRFSVLRMSS